MKVPEEVKVSDGFFSPNAITVSNWQNDNPE